MAAEAPIPAGDGFHHPASEQELAALVAYAYRQGLQLRNLWGFRFVDGRGEVHEVTREDADPDLFEAMCPNMGLLGVISTITFECVETFDIEGQEATTTIEDCAVDVFGAGSPGRPSLERFLREIPFARLEWWPQRGVERMVVWQAAVVEARPDFQPNPYRRFGEVDPEIAQHLFGIVFTIIGNLERLSAAKGKLEASSMSWSRCWRCLARRTWARSAACWARCCPRRSSLAWTRRSHCSSRPLR